MNGIWCVWASLALPSRLLSEQGASIDSVVQMAGDKAAALRAVASRASAIFDVSDVDIAIKEDTSGSLRRAVLSTPASAQAECPTGVTLWVVRLNAAGWGWTLVEKRRDSADCMLWQGSFSTKFGESSLMPPNQRFADLHLCHRHAAAFFAACHRVGCEDHVAPRQMRRRHERDGLPKPPRLRVLKLYRKTVHEERPTQAAVSGGGVALHWQRGHVKRRKSGYYWWDAHWRGDAGKGTVFKGYDVDTGA